jgi:hypothetical protein
MIPFYAQYRISNAIDTGKPLSPLWRRKLERDAELRAFTEGVARLERDLRAPAQPEPPPFIHASIMRAVEAAARPMPVPRRPWWLPWLPAPVLAALALVAGWWLLHPAPEPASIAPAATALLMSQQIAQTLPSTVLEPLTDEWHHLSLDLDNTARFLLANLP